MMKYLDVLLLQLCFLPTYLWYIKRINTGGEEVLSVLLVPVCVIVAYRFKSKTRPVVVHSNREKNIIVGGVSLYAVLWLIGCPAIIKASLAITVLLYYFGLLKSFGVSALAYCSLPWLSSFQYFLGYPLRRFVAECSAIILNLGGLSVEVQGTGLLYAGSKVFVDPPCSGVRMIWVILILTALTAVVYNYSWKKGMLLGFIALLIAVFGNVVRAVILFFPESNLVKWPGWTHESLGILVYLVVCAALLKIFSIMSHDKKITYTHSS